MARLLALISNRPDVGVRAIDLERRHLAVRNRPGHNLGWGVGFYQAGEILLKRRPIDDRTEIDLAVLTKDIRADILLTHVRNGTVGSPRTENTHPFRFRQWLYAQTGTVEGFAQLRGHILESLPVFLARDVKGDTDAELVFHLFLSFLQDQGHLDRHTVEPSSARAALASCISLVDRLCAEQGGAPSALNLMLTCSDYVVALHSGTKMAYRVYQGRTEMERLLSDGGLHKSRTPDEAKGRLTLIASDFDDDILPTGWTSVPERSIVTITRTEDPKVEAL
ncbi:MAG: class II glutamine amidotransferase [Polyangiaceae bacterium]|nr:class II glutamine amidotransferase [Polyangiaceae bacterium]